MFASLFSLIIQFPVISSWNGRAGAGSVSFPGPWHTATWAVHRSSIYQHPLIICWSWYRLTREGDLILAYALIIGKNSTEIIQSKNVHSTDKDIKKLKVITTPCDKTLSNRRRNKASFCVLCHLTISFISLSAALFLLRPPPSPALTLQK